MSTLANLEERVLRIEKRNKKVEEDKDWETSSTRKIALMVLTYIAIGSYLRAIGVIDPWKHAVIPTVAFMLSTPTLPTFKRMWMNYIRKNE